MLRYAQKMPKNKREIAPEIKRTEICEAALKRFMAHGYEGASVGKIAADLGVAQNTIYWYFKTKDDILVGALEHLSAQLYKQFMTMSDVPLVDRVAKMLEDASKHHCIFAILQWRLPLSPSLEAWHGKWHSGTQAFFVNRLCDMGIPTPQAELTTTVGMFVAEGIICHRLPPALRLQAIEWLCGAVDGAQVLGPLPSMSEQVRQGAL
jgi:TetR/AcrR family transcriptional regulator, regulator of autoinduction and epiphytic fitness